MKSKNWQFGVTVLAGLFLACLILTDGMAQGRGRNRGGGPGFPGDKSQYQLPADSMPAPGPGYLNKIPDLTKEQRDKIETSWLKMHKEILPIRNLLGEKKAHLKTLSTLDKVDQAAIDKTIDEIALLKAQIAKEKSQIHQEIRGLLTEKQRIIFDTKGGRKQGLKKAKMRGMGRGQGMNDCPNNPRD